MGSGCFGGQIGLSLLQSGNFVFDLFYLVGILATAFRGRPLWDHTAQFGQLPVDLLLNARRLAIVLF